MEIYELQKHTRINDTIKMIIFFAKIWESRPTALT